MAGPGDDQVVNGAHERLCSSKALTVLFVIAYKGA